MTPGWRPRRVPLYITCARWQCRAVKQVRTPYEQRTRKYCSRKCVAIMTAHLPRNREGQRQGGIRSGIKRRQQQMARLGELSRVTIWRMAWQAGWKSGARSVRKRLGVGA